MTIKKEKYQLPLFDDDKRRLPTGKFHTSFSEISTGLDCMYKYKLQYIDQIKLDDGSIHSAFGSSIHDSLEHYLLTKHSFDSDHTIKDFKHRVRQLEKQPTPEDLETFCITIPEIHEQFPGFMEETFPGYKVFGAEVPLFESIHKQSGIYLKGFIDAIIKVPKKRKTKESKCDFDYYIIDFKTCSFGWTIDQKTSYQKQLQLMLYKHFFCQLMNIDMSDVKCGFVLLKRVVPKKRKPNDRLELVPVSVGPKSIEKSQETLNTMINQIKRGFFPKNRMSCEPFCPYRNTVYCT